MKEAEPIRELDRQPGTVFPLLVLCQVFVPPLATLSQNHLLVIKRRASAAGRGLPGAGAQRLGSPRGAALSVPPAEDHPTPQPPRRARRRGDVSAAQPGLGTELRLPLRTDGPTGGRRRRPPDGERRAGTGNSRPAASGLRAMDGPDNATLLFAPSSLQPDNYTLSPNASSLRPGSDLPVAPTSSAGPSPGLSLAPSPGVGFSPGPTPTPEPTAGSSAGGPASLGPSLFPHPWAHPQTPFWDTPLNHGLNVFVGAALCITMLGLGCTVDVNHFGEHVRRPVGALLAALCQFGLLPLLAFLLALAFSLNEVAAVAVLLCGCCPGGNLSNLMSLLVDGDMNLRYGAVCSLGVSPVPSSCA